MLSISLAQQIDIAPNQEICGVIELSLKKTLKRVKYINLKLQGLEIVKIESQSTKYSSHAIEKNKFFKITKNLTIDGKPLTDVSTNFNI